MSKALNGKIKLLVISISLALLTACGYKGDLYLPDNNSFVSQQN